MMRTMNNYCICKGDTRWEWNKNKECFTCKYCGLFQDMKSFNEFIITLKKTVK